jgi:hypothetical protein
MRWFSLGTLLVFALACGGLFVQDMAVQPADKVVLMDVGDVVAIYPSLHVDPTIATFSKRRLTNGAIESIYRYKTPDGQTPTLLVESHVFVARDAHAAIIDYTAMKASLSLGGVGSSTVSREERPDAMAWGDDHRCIALLNAGNERGISCVARKDRAILLVLVAGALDTAPLSHNGGMDTLLGNRLEAIEAYQP